MSSNRTMYDSVDLLKFVLSIFVASIHAGGFGKFAIYAVPFQRLAVPLFFLASSYFFFTSYADCASVDERIVKLEKYVKRNLQLYLFWFVVLFVPTLAIRHWFEGGVLKGIAWILHSFLFGSTFVASWFIMACVLAVIFVAVASRYLRGWQMLLVAFVPYTACCLLTNYAKAPLIEPHLASLRSMFIGPCSFFSALVWFSMGKLLVEAHDFAESIEIKNLAIASAAGFAVLCLEHWWVVLNAWNLENDVFFSLPFVCVPLFLLVLRFRVSIPFARELRITSVVTYCLHCTLFFGLKVCLAWLGITLSEPVRLLVLLVLCWMVTAAILRLERLPHLRWLRYAH